MQLQLGGDSADAPAFGMIVAQDLRFNFWGSGQRDLSCLIGIGESDGAESPDARIPGAPDDTGGSARAAAMCISLLSVRSPVEQAGPVVGNSDASLSAVEPGIDADVQRGRGDREVCLDSDDQPIVTTGDVPATHIQRCKSDCRDHSGCT